MGVPERFERAYVRAFGARVPWALRRAYGLLEDYAWWGRGSSGEAVVFIRGGKRRGASRVPLAGSEILPFKWSVDHALAEAASALEVWQRAREAGRGRVGTPRRDPDLEGVGTTEVRPR